MHSLSLHRYAGFDQQKIFLSAFLPSPQSSPLIIFMWRAFFFFSSHHQVARDIPQPFEFTTSFLLEFDCFVVESQACKCDRMLVMDHSSLVKQYKKAELTNKAH